MPHLVYIQEWNGVYPQVWFGGLRDYQGKVKPHLQATEISDRVAEGLSLDEIAAGIPYRAAK